MVTPRPTALRAARIAPPRRSVLAEQRVAVRIENGSRFRLRVRVRDTVPSAFDGGDGDVSGVVEPRGEARCEYFVTPRTRGRFEWGPIFLRYRSLLGLWEPHEAAKAPPTPFACTRASTCWSGITCSPAPTGWRALGIRRVRHRGGSTEFESLRDYVYGDDVRRLDWKATARRSRLIVRNQESERNQTVLLLIDSGRLMNATENGVAKLDHAVNAALLLAHVALARGDRVGLCTFSSKVHSWLVPRGNLGAEPVDRRRGCTICAATTPRATTGGA